MANFLTTIRLLLTIPVCWAIADPHLMVAPTLLALLIAAVLSDFLDGIVARWANTASAFGRLFDHATDFIFVTSGLVGAVIAGIISPVLPALIGLAFTQYVLDSYFYYRDKQLRMSFLGRWNGIFYFVPLFLIVLSRWEIISPVSPALIVATEVLCWLLVVTTMLSIADRALAPIRKTSLQGNDYL